jgi:AcrR family transcriptional regulator
MPPAVRTKSASKTNAAATKIRTKPITPKADRREEAAKAAGAYHHGALREALLRAAERVLERDGVQGLTLRAAARDAGVSHAAPKHHFGDLAGLLSELAIVGFGRLSDFMSAGLSADMAARDRLDAIGRGYVAFAKAHPALFLMMFRSERLDMTRPKLRAAARAGLEVLASALRPTGSPPGEDELTLAQAGRVARAWSIVHGFSMLLIDGRWKPLLALLPEGADSNALFEAVILTRDRDLSAPASPIVQPL